MKRGLAFAASSIRRRSAAWTILLDWTFLCIVDDTGKIVREVKVASEPEALLAVLKNSAEPLTTLYVRFLGGDNLAWGLILWFARDWDRHAVRRSDLQRGGSCCLHHRKHLGSEEGLLNSSAWGSTIVLVLLLFGALYSLSTGPPRVA